MPQGFPIRKSGERLYHERVTTLQDLEARMTAFWAAISPRYAAYELLLPGMPSFVCQASLCTAHCCRAFSVSLGDNEVTRLRGHDGLHLSAFLECEDNVPVVLPLAQPYLLARTDGQCRLLSADLTCGVYPARPDACRLYPHFVLFFDPASGRPVHADVAGMRQSLSAVLERGIDGPYLLLLLRHVECPGFTGPPLLREAWLTLMGETARLQYGESALGDWPGS